MPVRKKTSTTKLPQSLQQQIEESAANHHPQNWRTSHGSRKETRKLERATQKQKKAEYFSHAPNLKKRVAEEEHSESPQHKRPRQADSGRDINIVSVPEQKPQKSPKPANLVPIKTPKVSAPQKLVKKALPVTKSAAESNENAYISLLESKLGLKKGGRKSKSAEEDDGLDDLMDWADSLVTSTAYNTHDNDEESTLESDPSDSSDDDESSCFESEEWHGISQENLAVENIEDDAQEQSKQLTEPTTKPAAYVPPHLRNVQKEQDNNSEIIQKLTRQLKGLLNRMTEQNIASIVDSFEDVYRDHRRNDVTTTLTTLLINGISAHSSLLDSYVVLHASFISSLHKVIGIEFAAHLVQSVVASYEHHYDQMRSSSSISGESDGKECSNLLVLISELYNFQVISCVLVFDIIRSLLNEDLTEFTVELILKIVRNSGQQLRQDDPSALKDIIDAVQGKVSTKDDAVSSRTRFMIETLTNLKNNKLKRNVTQNQGGAAVERMKKFLSGLSKTKHVLAHEPLRVSLEDLHSAETKGKWWLVGAAWHGNPLVDKQEQFVKPDVETKDHDPSSGESADFAALARSQGMNTDIRRGIFVVLMSSDDYIDACERLSQLNLTEVQQREIIRVILHCCGNERSYNPYYTLVCQQLCRTSHAYKITLQFSLWDFLRDLGETTVGGAAVIKNIKEDEGFDVKTVSDTRIQNVARAYAWWIAKGSVSLLILKPVDFTILKPRTQAFLKELFTQLFVNSQRSAPIVTSDINNVTFTRNRDAVEEIFIKASRVQALAMGLVFFLSDAFAKKSKPETELSKFLSWSIGVAKDTLRTGVDVVPTL